MSIEPNLRSFELGHWKGTPYGYGGLPAPPKFRPPGDTLNAVSRPQLTPELGRDSGGNDWHGSKTESLSEFWQEFKRWLGGLPGFLESVAGLLISPFRLLRWLFCTPGIRVVCWCVVIALVLLILGLPLVTSSGGDGRRAEGDQLLGSARDFARVEYSKSGEFGNVQESFQQRVANGEFEGCYYSLGSIVVPIGKDRARIYVYPTHPGERPGYIEFEWRSGNSEIHWDTPRRRR